MSEQYRELMIGAGSQQKKLLHLTGHEEWSHLTTLDFNPAHRPDVLWDLTEFPLPFDENSFNEIHAYEVREHTGVQGDYKFFFAPFSEFWRILRPDGVLLGTSPALDSPWLWGDPGHRRVICRESLVFLNQAEYMAQIGRTSMMDYRFIYKADFELVNTWLTEGTFAFVLRTIKPSRIEPESL